MRRRSGHKLGERGKRCETKRETDTEEERESERQAGRQTDRDTERWRDEEKAGKR